MIFYRYKKCSTCVKALKFLEANKIDATIKEIRETPPTLGELKRALKSYNGEIKKLLNTSGQDYRNLGLKDKLATMSDDEVLQMLSENGNLVKRPFLVVDQATVICGFKEEVYKPLLNL